MQLKFMGTIGLTCGRRYQASAVILMLLIVCLNLFFPLGKAAGEIKNKSS